MVIHCVAYVNVEGTRVKMVIHSVTYVNVEDSNGHSQCCICKRRGFKWSFSVTYVNVDVSNGYSVLHM